MRVLRASRDRLIWLVQIALLNGSYLWFKLFTPRRVKHSISWVVGPIEIASMVRAVGEAVPGSHSVLLQASSFYDQHYDSSLKLPSALAKVGSALVGPVWLGKLMNRAQGFIYIGSGFLVDPDYRAYEFGFLKKRGIAICCYWTGTDIRSTKLMRELEARTGVPNITTQIAKIHSRFESDEFDRDRRGLAAVADKFADVMFLHPHANRNYLTRPVEPFLYLFPDDGFIPAGDKFDNLSAPVIVHAPSSPVIKGTPLVRAAIERLRSEGYRFEYVELMGISNEEVKRELSRAHISLGHFYGFTPGVFGVESMAAACALLISADENLEPFLPEGSNEAWFVTKHDEVYAHLKLMLDKPELIEPLALRGQRFARENFSASRNAPVLNQALNDVLERGFTDAYL